ncbi:MAG: DNA methyltransferase, partial [Nannocystaceae bacterium]
MGKHRSSSDATDTGVELVWPGKYTAQGERATPAQTGAHLCTHTYHGAAADTPVGGKVVLGDNLASMQALCHESAGSVDLIYIDPPFATGSKFSVLTRIGDETRPDGVKEVRTQAYNDAWPGGLAGFLAFLGPRLRLLHKLLSPTGSMYIHVDPTVGHAVKLVCDEVFGPRSFQREIVWRIGWLSGFKTKAKNWIRNHDLIFFYTKDPRNFTFNKHYVPHPEGYRRRDGALPKGPGMPIEDVWNANASEQGLRGRDSLDSIQIKSFSTEKTGWATQKNESLLRRIIEASSNPGDTVLDVFCGSGTTAVVAASLGRRFVACDTSALAIHMTRKRLLEAVPAAPFDVCTLDDRERLVLADTSWQARVVAHHGGEAITDPVLHGLSGPKATRRAIWVGPLRGGVGKDAVAKVLDAARRGGYVGLDVLAWEPVSVDTVPSKLDVQVYRLSRVLLDARAWRRTGSGIVPQARVVATASETS